MRRRVLSAAAVAGLAVLSTSACAENVCPAVGWSNRIIVTADSLPAEAVDLRLCIDGECLAVAEPEELPLETTTALPEPSSEQATYSSVTVYSVERAGDEWTFNIDMTTPESVTVQATDAAGGPVAETTVDLDWQIERPHGEHCGGPGTAHVTVTL